MRSALVLVAVMSLSFLACPGNNENDGGNGGGSGGGSGGGTQAPFTVSVLDTDARELVDFAIAVDPATQRIGVAYYTPAGTELHQGTPDFTLKYLEWQNGTVTGPEDVGTFQRLAGLSVVFHPTTGAPLIAHLGGDEDLDTSIFWFQSDAAISTRTGGTWAETIVATLSNDVDCGNPVSNAGEVVGLYPAITFNPAGEFFFAYRDVHNGQFGMQDWNAADVEVWEGAGFPPGTGVCAQSGSDPKMGWGGKLQFAIGIDGQPALVHTRLTASAIGADGQGVAFTRRTGPGTWTPSTVIFNAQNTQTGPSLAYDTTEGYGIAVVDRSTNQLRYLRSANGSSWNEPDEVYGSGTGGWYPSLAMDPINHEPAIAFYVCGPRANTAESNCATKDDRLVVTQRIAGNWRETDVDAEGGWSPKLAFFSSGKRVLVYRQPSTLDNTGDRVTNVGELKIAVEQ